MRFGASALPDRLPTQHDANNWPEDARSMRLFRHRPLRLLNRTEALALRHEVLTANIRPQLRQVCEAIRELMSPPEPKRRPIAFIAPEEKKRGQNAQAKTPAGRCGVGRGWALEANVTPFYSSILALTRISSRVRR